MTAVGITGHRHIPGAALPYVRAEMRARLAALGPPIQGITSLAAGADQLFARMVLDLGGTLHVVVPSARYEGSFSEDGDLREYESLLARADSREVLGHDHPGEDAFLAAGHRVVDRASILFAVWDGMPARGRGGTADVVRYAARIGRETVILWPDGVARP
jgi:hypothetical protein